MSQEYIAFLVTLIAPLLPKMGVTIGNEQLTITLMTIVSIISALWGIVRRYRRGDINIFGVRKV